MSTIESLPSDATHVALVSGGKDSAVAGHKSVTDGPCDLLVYLDTRTGTEENKRYLERFADSLGAQLWTLRTHIGYGQRVRDGGFPGPSRHSIMYRSLKERQIQKLATVCDGYGNASDLYLWTGVSRHESDRRMPVVSPVQEAERWTWVAPCHDWRKERFDEYLREHEIPENPLWDTLGRSGDCFCGCFGNPEELIDAEAAGCERLVSHIRELEETVDRDDEKGTWAWGGLSSVELRAERAEDRDMTLCSSCGVPEP